MIKKIVSGGQTGVDQAALFIASKMRLAIGGWCPKGGLDENGICILETYASMQETVTFNLDERTRLNIRDSDGTLIIVPSWPLPEKIKDGTKLTIEDAERKGRPYLVVSLAEKDHVVDTIQLWISQHHIKILNIGGPRESSSPGIYQESCELFLEVFSAICTQK